MVGIFKQSSEGMTLVIDPEYAQRLGLKDMMEAEISFDGEVLKVALRRGIEDEKFDRLLDQTEAEYDDVFKKLAE